MRLSTRSVSQPEPVVPKKSKTPISASRPAAVTSGNAVIDAGRE